MPRAKRPLAEADPNASRAPADAKRAKPIPAKNTTNTIDGYESRSKEELGTILKERGLPHTGTKKVLNQRLEASRYVEGPSKKGDHSKIPSDNTSQTLPQTRSDCFTRSRTGSRSRAVDVGPKKTKRPEEESGSSNTNKATINYWNKDNSKLRTLLSDRGLSASGTREEMITRLQNTVTDYERFSSAAITEMLRRRQQKMCGQGSKDSKIKRLMLNDELDHDSGNLEDIGLYAQLSVKEDFLNEYGPECLEGIAKKYLFWKLERLTGLLEERKLSSSGKRGTLIDRLQNDDRKTTHTAESPYY